LFPESGDKGTLTENEIKLVAKFNEQGNGMLISLGNRQTNPAENLPVNQLSSRYGVNFYGSAVSEARISIGMASQLFSSASELLGRFLKIMHKA
jgi:hypothetical protein